MNQVVELDRRPRGGVRSRVERSREGRRRRRCDRYRHVPHDGQTLRGDGRVSPPNGSDGPRVHGTGSQPPPCTQWVAHAALIGRCRSGGGIGSTIALTSSAFAGGHRVPTQQHHPSAHHPGIAATVPVARRVSCTRLMENARKEDARRAGLSPVLVYALIVEGVGTCTIRLLPWANPLPARTFLFEAWAKGSPLGHLPHTLKTGRRFAEAMPWLADFCQSVGVTLVVASGNDRSYNVNQAVAQSTPARRPFRILGGRPIRSPSRYPRSTS